MYHADLLGGLAAKFAGNVPVSWGIRYSDPSAAGYGSFTSWTIKVCAGLSRWIPVRIVCCSEAARDSHLAFGYAKNKMVVIPNGVDLTVIKPDRAARVAFRSSVGISDEAPVVGLVGRFHPQKGHRDFIKAAQLLHDRCPSVHFVLCGEGITWGNETLASWIDEAGLRESFRLLGRRDDIPQVMASLDLAALSSAFGEGFPNVVSEAMGCGVPCVVTDVGHAAKIVGDTGMVVPPRDPVAMANAWERMLGLGQVRLAELGQSARQRIREHFALPAIVDRYQALFEEIVAEHAT
jgi:glycosyltransferase involved in cell wall biosynthesis